MPVLRKDRAFPRLAWGEQLIVLQIYTFTPGGAQWSCRRLAAGTARFMLSTAGEPSDVIFGAIENFS